MLPHMGQGAAQAIEDAAVLGVLLNHLSDAEEVPRRLEMFERARRQRVGAAQILSRILVGVDSTLEARERCWGYFAEGEAPGKLPVLCV